MVNDDGLVEVEIGCGGGEFCCWAEANGPIELKVSGSLMSGRKFYGVDTIELNKVMGNVTCDE